MPLAIHAEEEIGNAFQQAWRRFGLALTWQYEVFVSHVAIMLFAQVAIF